MKKILIRVALALAAALALTAAAFTIWAYTPPKPIPEALQALESSSAVTVSELGAWISFEPAIRGAQAIIFYPGGRVDPRSYAPLLRRLAEQGVTAFLVKSPFNLAFFSLGTAAKLRAAHPGIKEWYLAGHSLGGVAAVEETAVRETGAAEEADGVRGLILLASYPARDISKASFGIVSISGELDGLATREKIDESRKLLPPTTTFVEIKGGNHAQFGYYGDQKGDRPATISREDQQTAIAESILYALNARQN